MKFTRKVVYFFLLIIWSVPVWATEISTSDAKRFIELSGMEGAIDSIPGQIQSTINEIVLTSREIDRDQELGEVMLRSWDPEAIWQAALNHLQETSNSEEVSELLAWYESPLARTIKVAESEAEQPNFESNMLRYIAGLKEAPPAKERLQLVRSFVDTTEMAEMMTALSLGVVESMLATMQETLPDFHIKDLDQLLEEMEETIASSMEQNVMLMSLYIYRDISDPELKAYTEFYNTELGRRELVLGYGLLDAVISTWANELAKEIATYNKQLAH